MSTDKFVDSSETASGRSNNAIFGKKQYTFGLTKCKCNRSFKPTSTTFARHPHSFPTGIFWVLVKHPIFQREKMKVMNCVSCKNSWIHKNKITHFSIRESRYLLGTETIFRNISMMFSILNSRKLFEPIRNKIYYRLFLFNICQSNS